MMRRSYALYPLALLACLGLLIAAFAFLWETTVQMLDRNGQGLLKKEQQLKHSVPMQAPAQPPGAPSEAENQRIREIAEAKRAAELRKQEAWERYYHPPRACVHPENSQRIAVCLANEEKQRKEFELAWAEQLQQERQGQR